MRQSELSFDKGRLSSRIIGRHGKENLMSSQAIRVIVAMPHYWVVGRMPTSGVRLQDLLAHTNTDFISLADAEIFSNDAERLPLAQLSEVLIPKKQILCVSTSGEAHEAPVKRLYNFQSREQSSVVLMVDNYLVEGLAHLSKSATSVAYTLYRGSCLFFPLTQATVRSGNSQRIKFPFLLVNSEHLRTVGLSMANDVPVDKPPHVSSQADTGHAQAAPDQDCVQPSAHVIVESASTEPSLMS
jgi:hypothetical protein